jgi:excisionase family DNA binding protein
VSDAGHDDKGGGPMKPDPSAAIVASPTTPALALRPREAAKALGIGERLLWSMTNRGEIPHIKLGRATLYPVAELERWLSERAAQK